MTKSIATVSFLAAVLAGLFALPSCEQRREDDRSPVQGDQGDPEYVVAVVLDVSGSYLERIKGKNPLAYKFFLRLATNYAADRAASADRILIAQISRKEPAILWEGWPKRLRSDFSGPDSFRDFVLARSDANGSLVYAGIAATIERVLEYPGVQAGRTRSAIFVLSDMEDNDPDGPAQKARLLEGLRRYAKVRHGCVGFYWVQQQRLVAEWTGHLTDAGVRRFNVSPDYDADPAVPTFD